MVISPRTPHYEPSNLSRGMNENVIWRMINYGTAVASQLTAAQTRREFRFNFDDDNFHRIS
jgi:hypothetical protein